MEVALLLQRLQEREHSAVGVLLEHLGELAHLDACNAGELLGVGGHLREQLRECRCRHLILLHVLIEYRAKAHDLRLREPELFADTCHASRELHEVVRLRRGVLRQFVDRRAGGEHRPAQSHALILAERHRQLSDLVHRLVSEVIAQRHADFVRRVDELLDALLGGDAQATCRPGQLVELLARRACVHLLEVLVHLSHLLIRLPGIFSGVRHDILHGGESVGACAHRLR